MYNGELTAVLSDSHQGRVGPCPNTKSEDERNKILAAYMAKPDGDLRLG